VCACVCVSVCVRACVCMCARVRVCSCRLCACKQRNCVRAYDMAHLHQMPAWLQVSASRHDSQLQVKQLYEQLTMHGT